MAKYIKNIDIITRTYQGSDILAGEYFLIIPSEEPDFSEDEDLLVDITGNKAIMAKDDSGLKDISDINESINFLKDINQVTETVYMPFASKTMSISGVKKSLFKRVHGVSETALKDDETYIDFVIPYPHCKFSGANIIGCKLKDKVDFLVLDNVTNTYSGLDVGTYGANFTLNKFGFDVEMPDEPYENTSNYDADLYYGMVIRCIYKNTSLTDDKYIAVNFWLHEVK